MGHERETRGCQHPEMSSAPERPKAENEIQDPDVPMQSIPQETEKAPCKRENAHNLLPRTSRNSPPSLLPDSRAETPLASLPAEPPVTKATLSELDVAKIVTNCKLRHDINFDADLHFRPNLDGDKGKKKKSKAETFWNTLNSQLEHFVRDAPGFYAQYGKDDNWCLPALLRAVKEIIQTLVPQRDRQFLDEGLNVELLVQQFYRGVMDLDRLASWLSKVLKSHCAPMRDGMVDLMHERLSTGNRTDDLPLVVDGLRSLLNVLEAMKLDVANHQIRCLRPLLIDDTVNFEQKFFSRKIRSGKLDISLAKQWYNGNMDRYRSEPPAQPVGEMSVFFHGLSRLILPSSAGEKLPSTFLFDEDRILKLRADLLDMINLEICMRLHQSLETVGGRHGEASHREEDDEFDFNTPPTTRPSSMVFSTAGSAGSSPRSSMVIPSYLQDQCDGDSATKKRNLYNSLVALLQSIPASSSRPHARWFTLANSMAVQIFRFTSNVPPMLHQIFEQSLNDSLCNPKSDIFADVEKGYLARLQSVLERKVPEFKDMDGNTLFKMATSNRNSALSHLRERDDTPEHLDDSNVEDVATRLAHLGSLHWRVWAQMAYVGDIDDMSLDAPQPSQI